MNIIKYIIIKKALRETIKFSFKRFFCLYSYYFKRLYHISNIKITTIVNILF